MLTRSPSRGLKCFLSPSFHTRSFSFHFCISGLSPSIPTAYRTSLVYTEVHPISALESPCLFQRLPKLSWRLHSWWGSGSSVQLLPLSVVDGDIEMPANFPEGGEGKVQMVTLKEKSWEMSDQIYSCNYISSVCGEVSGQQGEKRITCCVAGRWSSKNIKLEPGRDSCFNSSSGSSCMTLNLFPLFIEFRGDSRWQFRTALVQGPCLCAFLLPSSMPSYPSYDT